LILDKMGKIKKCVECKRYTLKKDCPSCGKKTKETSYKFVKY